jgi:hypothetical protein
VDSYLIPYCWHSETLVSTCKPTRCYNPENQHLQRWRWRQYVPPKCWCLSASPHAVTTQKTNIFRVEDEGSMFLRNVCVYLQVHTPLQPRKPTSSELKMKAVCSSETLVSNCKSTRRYNPENHLQIWRWRQYALPKRWYLRIQSVSQRKHNTSPLQRSTGQCC